MAVLAADLVEKTRRPLLSGQEEKVNRLDGAITSGATSLSLKYDANFPTTTPTLLAVDLEEIRVWDVTVASRLAGTVERGVNGSTAAAHSDLAMVTVSPKFSSFRILEALNEDLDDLSSPMNGLFQVKTLDITYNPSIQGYDLTGTTDILDLLDLRHKTTGPSKDWPLITDYALIRSQATAEFPSGNGLILYQSAFPGQPIHVVYAAPFSHLTTLASDVQTVTGLPATANDIPPMGAIEQLVGAREIKRNFTESQGEPRRATEVPPGATRASVAAVSARRQRRIAAEATRLRSRFPVRTKARR